MSFFSFVSNPIGVEGYLGQLKEGQVEGKGRDREQGPLSSPSFLICRKNHNPSEHFQSWELPQGIPLKFPDTCCPSF